LDQWKENGFRSQGKSPRNRIFRILNERSKIHEELMRFDFK